MNTPYSLTKCQWSKSFKPFWNSWDFWNFIRDLFGGILIFWGILLNFQYFWRSPCMRIKKCCLLVHFLINEVRSHCRLFTEPLLLLSYYWRWIQYFLFKIPVSQCNRWLTSGKSFDIHAVWSIRVKFAKYWKFWAD